MNAFARGSRRDGRAFPVPLNNPGERVGTDDVVLLRTARTDAEAARMVDHGVDSFLGLSPALVFDARNNFNHVAVDFGVRVDFRVVVRENPVRGEAVDFQFVVAAVFDGFTGAFETGLERLRRLPAVRRVAFGLPFDEAGGVVFRADEIVVSDVFGDGGEHGFAQVEHFEFVFALGHG